MQRYLGVDWMRVREEMKACRETAHLNQSALARKIGVNKSTVNRIENVDGEPGHAPDLDTIERWVQATGVKLSVFFARIEAHAAGMDSAQKRTTTSVTSLEGSHDADHSVSSDRRALEELRAFILRLGDVLTDAAAPPDADESRSDPSARPEEPGRG